VRQFFLDPDQWPDPPVDGETITLDDQESRHLLKVLRARPGDPVRLTDGRGRIVAATLIESAGRRAQVLVSSVTTDTAELVRPRLVLACGLIKGKRWESLLETAVELGAHRIVPLKTRRSEVDPGGGRRRRWDAAVLSALKQSGRSWRPSLDEPRTLAEFLDAQTESAIFYGRARDRERSALGGDLLTPAAAAATDGLARSEVDLIWCVGPEGGWSDDESALLASRGRAVRLSSHRLRTATAAAAGLLLLASRRDLLLDSATGTGPGPFETA